MEPQLTLPPIPPGQPQPGYISPQEVLEPPKRNRRRWLFIGLFAAGFVGLVVAGLTIFLLTRGIHYTVFNTLNFKTESSATAPSFSIEYPEQLREAQRDSDSISFEHNKKDVIFARLGLQGMFVGENLLAQEKDTILSEIKKGQGVFYTGFVDTLEEDFKAKKYKKIEFGTFSSFTNTTIKEAAIGDISLQGANDLPVKARLLVAIGKQHIYIVIIAAEASVWDANQKAWDRMFDSLLIDT